MAKDRKNSLFYMVLVLTLITFISAAGLSLVNKIVQEPIRISIMKETLTAINEVLPDHDNNPFEDMIILELNGKEHKVYPGKKGGSINGIAFTVYSDAGYGGRITIMIGINTNDSKVYGMYVLSHSETPGLGDRMRNKEWQESQFHGIIVSEDYSFKVEKDGGDIDVLTAATITARAVCDAFNTAYPIYEGFLKYYEEKSVIYDDEIIPEPASMEKEEEQS